MKPKIRHSLIPLIVLILMIALSIALFGSDSLSGANQISLMIATSVCVGIGMGVYKVKWKTIEKAMEDTIGCSSTSIVILLMIGLMAGSWMVSGVVPTLIYYGIQIMSPTFFLFCACIICSLVSVMTGSSWTTVATIGIAILGIGKALGVPDAWTAGAIISGAYFGDKISPLSDTTVLASSAAQVNIFEHIRYMLRTTVPTISIALLVFLLAGFFMETEGAADVQTYLQGLRNTFNISAWALIVPVFTGIMIAKKVPALITLFLSGLCAGILAVILQPDIVVEIAGNSTEHTAQNLAKGVMITFFTSTNIDCGNAELNDLVATNGMAGMLNTVWLILCAMCFGGAMTATGMLQCITKGITRWVTGRTSLVSCTAFTGFSLNCMTSDQYMSIVLTANMYRDMYKEKGYEGRLLSRTTEDSTTVTSVLIPWNTCGMTQSTVLGVATIEYLPYCVFNYLSPLITIFMAWIASKNKHNNEHKRQD